MHEQRVDQFFHQLFELNGIVRYPPLPRGNLCLEMPNFFVTEDIKKVTF